MIINEKRALAYTATVTDIQPIDGADNIELIHVLGWPIISKIGEFKPGDMCVFFEIDSKVPEAPWSEFLASKHYKIKTMKLSKFGVFSQGLALPFSAFDEELQKKISEAMEQSPAEYVDLTDVIGVTYSYEEDNARKANISSADSKLQSAKSRHKKFFANKLVKKLMRYPWFRSAASTVFSKKSNDKAFPSHFPYVHKTDEERVENMPWVLNDPNTGWIVTEKLDGTSCTYILERKRKKLGKPQFEFYVSSRNVRQLRPDQPCYHDTNIYWELAQKYDIEKHLKEYLTENPDVDYVCIQGEGVGAVQGNPLRLIENTLFVFNFIDSIHGRLSSTDGEYIVRQWGIHWVPIIDKEFFMPADITMEDFKKMATGSSEVNSKVLREGLVYRKMDDPMFSFKNVSREYLMKHAAN